MAWHDDDFPDESTDPGRLKPVAPTATGYPGGGPTPGAAYPGQLPASGAYPVQPAAYPQPGSGVYPAQPGAYPPQPGSGTYPAQGAGAIGAAPAYPSTPGAAGYPAPAQTGPHQPPITGGYPAQPGHAPNTGGYAQAPGPPASGAVPVLAAPVVAIEEEAQASRVVYGLSGTAVGGIVGVILGVLNTQLEGQTITEGTDFILQMTIWCSFVVGALAFWKPERFLYAIERFTNKDDD